jgi:hypothetical protein
MPGEPCAPYAVERFLQNPIITPAMLGNAAEDINGPKLIKAPDWLPRRLGTYYLYFAHHEGRSIRLATADDLRGPWRIHAPGVLPIDAPQFTWNPDHIASPDVLVDDANRRLLLYFHTPVEPVPLSGDPDYVRKIESVRQDSFVATSADGLDFAVRPESLGRSYFRVWRWRGQTYALPRRGFPLYRSATGFAPFEQTRSPFEKDPAFKDVRHVAVLCEDDLLTVFYTRIGDAPESVLVTSIRLAPDWNDWRADPPRLVLAPETGYEGAALPVRPSRPGSIVGFENALRDPDVYREDGRLYLLYAVEGERGIAIAELKPRG